jgi:predicted Zn-dependent protease
MGLLHRGTRPPFVTPPPFQTPSEPPPAALPEEKKPVEEEKPPKPVIQTDTMAEIYLKQGHPERALEVYQDILAKDPQNTAVKEKYEALKRTMGKDQGKESRRKVQAKLEKWLGVVSSKN